MTIPTLRNRKSRRTPASLGLLAAVLLWGLASVLPALGQQEPAGSWNPLPEPLAVVPESPISDEPATQAEKALTPAYEDQVMEIVNQERWNNGQLPPLKRVALLDTSSELHSTNMGLRNFFMHCDPDTGKSPYQRMSDAGYFYSTAGENIAAGQATPASVMTGWMNSSGHRANILNTGFREIGIGYYLDSSDTNNIRGSSTGTCTVNTSGAGPYLGYWTQNFGARNSVYPVVINREAFETTSLSVSLYVYRPGNGTQMRFSNDGINWSAWAPFSNNTTWTLSQGNGTKTVYSQVLSGSTVFAASDTIEVSGQVSNVIFSDSFESGTTVSWPSL